MANGVYGCFRVTFGLKDLQQASTSEWHFWISYSKITVAKICQKEPRTLFEVSEYVCVCVLFSLIKSLTDCWFCVHVYSTYSHGCLRGLTRWQQQ